MIHVTITCAATRDRSVSVYRGTACDVHEDSVPLGDVAAWHAATIAEHAWTVDADGNTYCPRHNPSDHGALVDVRSVVYAPLGDSGWEARLPNAYYPPGMRDVPRIRIEIRKQRGDDDA